MHTVHPIAIEILEPRQLLSAAPSNSNQPDMVLKWNEITLDVLRADRSLPGPGWSSRNMAIASIAVFDAVNTLDRSHRAFNLSPRGFNSRNTSMDAAIASAAHDALLALYPTQQSLIDQKLVESLATVPNGSKENNGVELGSLVAAVALASRADDGSDAIVPYTPNPAAGHWQPDPLNDGQVAWGPAWGDVDTFALRNGDQFRAPPPPGMNSAAYAASFNQVKSLGEKGSTARRADQTQIGVFWGYDRTGMGTPPALYCQAVETIAKLQHNDIVENARLFALVNVAQADAGIAAWDSKFLYDLWRPVTAIRRGAEDGNAATTADPTWTPLGAPGSTTIPNFTPPFPAYVSGHATFGAAVFRVLADFYHTDRMRFTLKSDELAGVTRSYTRLSQAANENAMSRIYLGIHWSFDATEGEAMGRRVGDWVMNHFGGSHQHGQNRSNFSAGANTVIKSNSNVQFADLEPSPDLISTL